MHIYERIVFVEDISYKLLVFESPDDVLGGLIEVLLVHSLTRLVCHDVADTILLALSHALLVV